MIRIGTVGTGFILDRFLDAVSRVPEMEAACAYSRDAAKAKAFAKQRGIARWSADRDAFLNDPAFNFVYIAAPNSLHYAWCRDALRAGKNVICEKPFVSTPQELEALIALAKERGLFLFEALMTPHLPNYRLVRAHLPDIGALRFVQLNLSQYSSRYEAFLAGKNPNIFNPAFSGGALMDINYYNLCFILNLFGEPLELRYTANIAANGADTSGVLVLRYDGFLCTAVGAKDSRSENFAQLQGEKGYIYIPQESGRCVSMEVRTADGAAQYNEQQDPNPIYYELCDFADIYLSRDLLRLDELYENCLLAARMTQAARRSAGIVFPADSETPQ